MKRKYYLIEECYGRGSCLACTSLLQSDIKPFCFECKSPRPPSWSTGNKSLDLFITESWRHVRYEYDTYIQWIKYSLLTDVQEMTSLRHGCTHIANWLNQRGNELIRVTLKHISDRQSFDFYQVKCADSIKNVVTIKNALH